MTSGQSSAVAGTDRLWAKPALDVDTEQVMVALERGFPVRLIGTFKNLVTCRIGDRVDEVVDRADAQEFDHLPVKDGDKIVGLLKRRAVVAGECTSAKGSGELVRNAFDPLDETNIIAADAGILVFLLKAKASPCRLILAGDRVTGLVSKSDLQRLPVRALLFHVVTHLELAIAAWIRRFSVESSWLAVLSKDRRKFVENRYDALAKSNLAIDRLTATMFADKRSVLLKLGEFSTSFRQDEKELKRIEELRDTLAHSGDYALTEDSADRMIETVAMARSWIERLSILLPKSKT